MKHNPGGKVLTRLPDGMFGSATFGGANEEYRLLLSRWWDCGDEPLDQPYVLWIGMNPSTATAEGNDPTVRREIGFTKRLGFKHYVKTNVMDYRATFPRDLRKPGITPCTADNIDVIAHQAKRAAKVIVCYGAVHASLQVYPDAITKLLSDAGIELWCLGLTQDGHPKHPLRLANATPLVPFRRAA